MRRDLIWRALVPAASLAALAASAPRPVSGGLALAGLALAADVLARRRDTVVADRALVGVGGVLVVLVLTGMVLGSTPLGLSPTSWTVSVSVLGLVGLGAALVVRPRRDATDGLYAEPHTVAGLAAAEGQGRVDVGQTLRLLPWVAVAVVVVALLVRASAASLSAADEPPLQMSFGEVSGTDVQVVVSSSDPVGPLEIRTSNDGTDLSYPLFEVDRDGSVSADLMLPRTGRYVITLNRPDQTTPLRTLILDR